MKPKFSKLIKKYPRLGRRNEEDDSDYKVVTEVRRTYSGDDEE